jgi:pyruvate-formate lyase
MATPAKEVAIDPFEHAWKGFNIGLWQSEINVRDFIQQNYDPYEMMTLSWPQPLSAPGRSGAC